ncbi:hypothetical protein JCM11251_004277 [Rhodosporidiobolus azoricus]
MRPLLQEHPPPLAPLPAPTQSLLRSSTILPSLPSLLSELVQNSLDAHATRITASVDLDTWTLKVTDDGLGFTGEGIAQLATEGRRYSTSKLAQAGELSAIETYGFRGEALASIVDVATLEIRSTSALTGETSDMVLRGREVVKLVTRERGEAPGRAKGTTVWARDIFFNFPVRRRPLHKPSAQSTLLTHLRSTLSTLSLVHPHVAFSLIDTTTSSSASLSAAAVTGEAKSLLQLNRANEGLIGRWRQIWGRAGVEKAWEFEDFEGEVEAGKRGEGGRVKARGFFSLSAAHSKAGQYIFVNSRPLSPTSSPLHKHLNSLISSSSFARHGSSHLSYSPSKPSPASPVPPRQSPKKTAEKFAVFVVCLDVPGGWVDVSLEPEKRVVEFSDPKRIETFLSSLTKKFLVENGFASAAPVAPKLPPQAPTSAAGETPKKRTREAATAVASTAGRKKVSVSVDAEAVSSSTPRPTSRPAPRAVDPPTVDPFAPSLPLTSTSTSSSTPTLPGYTRWTDPTTLQTFLVDLATGNSWREGTRPDVDAEIEGSGQGCRVCGGTRSGTGRKERGFVERGWLKRRRDEREDEEAEGEGEDMPEWLKGTLDDWQNPIFPSVPASCVGAAKIPSLPSLPVNGPSTAPTLSSAFSSSKPGLSRPASAAAGVKRASSSGTTNLTQSRLKTMTDFFSTSTSSYTLPHSPLDTEKEPTSLLPLGIPGSSNRLTRVALSNSKFIAQVDDKFLLIRVPSSTGIGGGTLVLVDQHAASERVRVERFWGLLTRPASRGGVETRSLEGEERAGVVVGREEARDVERWRGNFSRWGVEFASFELEGGEAGHGAGQGGGDYVQLFMTAVPALLAARLTTEPRTAQELVRSFVAQLRERGGAARGAGERGEGDSGGKEGDAAWVGRVKDAPPVLVELVNSKACRGAVMFNDVLSAAQSTSLLRALAMTKFPFQCAHGRPSMVPLVELPTSLLGGGGGGGRGGVVDWEKFA